MNPFATTGQIIAALSQLRPDEIRIGMNESTGAVVFQIHGGTVYECDDERLGDWLLARSAEWRAKYCGERPS